MEMENKDEQRDKENEGKQIANEDEEKGRENEDEGVDKENEEKEMANEDEEKGE